MKQSDAFTIKGHVKIFSRAAGSDDAWKLQTETDNLVMTGSNTGRDLLIQWLLGLTTYTGGIAWGAIGTSNTTPTLLDTQLGAETNRTSPSFQQDSGFNEAVIQFFFPDNVLANTTYYEFGSFVGGTSAAKSGQIFNHALFSIGYAKVAGQDTTLELDLTIS